MPDDDLNVSQRLSKIQGSELSGIGRRDDLGRTYYLEDAVEPLQKAQGVFRVPPAELLHFLTPKWHRVVEQATAEFEAIFNNTESFEPSGDNATGRREDLLSRARVSFDHTFDKLHPAIAYAAARRTDFKALDHEARELLKQLTEGVNKYLGCLQPRCSLLVAA
ncbi:MAG: hypothetical protein QUV02_02340 [Maricaulis sp.]|uniref:hypothetical protein n=1 Tax=Maricaulis sp. TaxID=1486257 RepID=UPI0026243D0E|nr:hypothetical protein [Maricaulis sp.]MDM7983261.1 hypothetical protein [Maricaulis sp.]